MIRNSDSDNIFAIIKLLENTLITKLNEKDIIIKNLINENNNLREQLKKRKNRKNKINNNIKNVECTEIEQPMNNNVEENVIIIDPKPMSKAKCKEATEFFKKEFNKYQQKK
ncbi:hypothetical protein Catovirus_2_22 [Catovirus CTV1]|uniref:Uncharacterized protein n=1 Tax=Catovirus CTV1 TaxID=1977631 RepID=A0A1V0SBI7_9VIRU|nr:hypothetical protein Catovirus_2_22 [Catovirus CTV1]